MRPWAWVLIALAVLALSRRGQAAGVNGGAGGGGAGGGGGFPVGYEEAGPFPSVPLERFPRIINGDVPLERFPRILPEEPYACAAVVRYCPPGELPTGPCPCIPTPAGGPSVPSYILAPNPIGVAIGGAVVSYAPIPGTTEPVAIGMNVGGASRHRLANIGDPRVF